MGRISIRLLCLSHSWFGVISASLWHLFLLQKSFCYLSCLLFSHLALYPPTHPATRRRSDVVTTSLCMSQWPRRYVSNETPNDVSVVRLHGIILDCRDDVSRGRNSDVPSVRLLDVPKKSQMKHPTASQWYVTKTSQRYVCLTSH